MDSSGSMRGMARALRLEFTGATCHLMARGNQGQPVFAADLNRQRWLETLAEGCVKTGWQVHAHSQEGQRDAQ